jgi:serine/threonine-protein kinase HipA
MSELKLDVRLDGFAKPVGYLTKASEGVARFVYDASYLAQPSAVPLSLSLPLTETPFSETQARPFFANLLQERDQPIRRVVERFNVDANDIVGLLFHLGTECAGAVSVLPEGAPPIKVPGNPNTDYVVLSQAQIESVVLALHRREPLPLDRFDNSPLSGYQSKISLCCLADGTYALAKGRTGAPTTHVLKVPDRNHLPDAKREHLALRLSSMCGQGSILSECRSIAGIDCLITTRFDRTVDERGFVHRIHQEDFAQALALPPSLKYQRYGTGDRIFNAEAIASVLAQTVSPPTATLGFIRDTIFDLLIGNADAHAKNHALVYMDNKRPRPSLRYDILPTRLDDTISAELPFQIGTASQIEDVDQQALSIFLNVLGIKSTRGQLRVIAESLDAILPPLVDNLDILQSINQKSFADLIAANMRELLPKLGYPVPKQAEHRDAHVVRGGGWLTS